MSDTISGAEILTAIERVADQLEALRDPLNQLDAAVGDGDLGITAFKGAGAIRQYIAANSPDEDLGKFLSGMGMAFNRAASSTMGALVATSLMRAGREARGKTELDGPTVAKMLEAADIGIQERGKAQPGDKTIIDALHPAADAFSEAIQDGSSMQKAGAAMLEAARVGRDSVIPMRSKTGRAGWVGERTVNQPDPGTVLLVRVMEAALGTEFTEPGSTI